MSSLTHEDLLAYERFLTDPQPVARWLLDLRYGILADPAYWDLSSGSPARRRLC
jgi:hypothetical protein